MWTELADVAQGVAEGRPGGEQNSTDTWARVPWGLSRDDAPVGTVLGLSQGFLMQLKPGGSMTSICSVSWLDGLT